MKMKGLLLAQVCGLRAKCWQMELVISRLIRTGTPTIVALNNNNNNGLSCQLGVGQASQPASFFSFIFYFYLQWRERRGVSKRVLVLRRRRWGLSFLLCVDLSPPSKESWKRIKKSSERERERERQQHYRLRYLLLNYYSSAGWSGFSNRLWRKKESCKDINSSR